MKKKRKLSRMAAVRYEIPSSWIKFDILSVVNELIEAKAAVQSLTTIPSERNWVEKLQQMQLKMEVAGTSRIEGAAIAFRTNAVESSGIAKLKY